MSKRHGPLRVAIVIGSIVGALALLYGVLLFAMPAARSHAALTEHSWQVIAHQGGNHLRPGDTMAAFEHAVELGVDVLEMDVHATSDGDIVVIHDKSVDRTTNGTGLVSEMTLAEIKALDAGYNWPLHQDTEDHPYRGVGVEIPTLEEVLAAYPDMPMVIEIKQAEPSVVKPFGELLRRFNRANITIVPSSHPQVINEFRTQFPEFATAGVESEILTFFILNKALLGRLYPPRMEAFQVPERSGNLTVVTPRFVRVAQSNGVAVHVWTVNETEDMRRILNAGVDGIMTDRPDLLLELLGRR